MKVLTIALAAVLASAASAHAADPSLVAQFQKYCRDTGGKADAAIKAARADGFVALPAQSQPMANITAGEAVWIAREGGAIIVLVGKSKPGAIPTLPTVGGDFCGVLSKPAAAGVEAELEKLMGYPADRDARGAASYFYTDVNGAVRNLKIADQNRILQVVDNGRAKVVSVGGDAQGTMVALIALHR